MTYIYDEIEINKLKLSNAALKLKCDALEQFALKILKDYNDFARIMHYPQATLEETSLLEVKNDNSSPHI